MTRNPFDLSKFDAYARWRDQRLAEQPIRLEDLIVDIADPRRLSKNEHAAILARVRRSNMAIYASPVGESDDKTLLSELGQQFGLTRLDHNLCADEDAISSLQVASDALHAGYIPYTNRPITWHTDGYYNPPEDQIEGLILHCVRQAAQGGDNRLLDHELVYIHLRDQEPEFVRALSAADVMTIPANTSNGEVLRPARSGPVFSVTPSHRLHMRYTHRRRNVIWRDDEATQSALRALREFLDGEANPAFTARLQPGWGVICNNVLHTRDGFEADSQRLLFRGRYLQRIADS